MKMRMADGRVRPDLFEKAARRAREERERQERIYRESHRIAYSRTSNGPKVKHKPPA